MAFSLCPRTSASRIAALLITLAVPASAHGQFPPERTKNLKVLPGDIPIRALIDTMKAFTRALGVRCSYCHVGAETDPLESYDFASDEKPAKHKARAMLRMVATIDGELLPKLADRRTPPITIGCMTCHRGVTEPRPLQQILHTAYDAGGVDSLERAYRSLRQRYYGRAAYDFGEVPLVDVADAVRVDGHLTDALRIYLLNAEFSPNSGFAFRSAAGAQVAAGDTTAAVESLRRALAINPNDTQAKETLRRLGRDP